MTTQPRLPELTPGRRRLLWGVTLALPFLFLALLEAGLRIANYGDDLDLVTERRAFGRDWYALNSGVGRRYFSQPGIAVPEVYDDLFEKQKSPRTKRIFMLGESTMAGYPFDYNATPARLLQDQLQFRLPQYHIEVINAALAAVNSYTVLDFIGELSRYEPDAFVVYVGHNEFYGALGVASTESSGGSRTLTRLMLKLRTVKIVQLLRNGLLWARGAAGSAPERRDATLMEVMAREKTIPYQSDDYRRARDVFEANLRDIVGVAAEHRIPVVLSTLASNLRDQEPLVPAFSPGLSAQDQARWSALMAEGDSAAAHGGFRDAAARYRAAVAVDSLQAESQYRLARCLDTLGERPAARAAYGKARDYDALRFRASAEFSDLIRRLGRELEVPVADADSAFAAASPDGLVGRNLMMEHLHPNFDGYRLLAATLARAIASTSALAPPGEYRPDAAANDATMKKLARVTAFDIEVANYRVRELTSRWPFRAPARSTPPADSLLRSLVERYARKRIAWSQAHFDLAAAYRDRKDYGGAIAEYAAVSKVVPYSYYPFLMIGDAYQLAGERDSAASSYARGLEAENSPFLHVRLGMLAYERDSTALAIREFELTLAAVPSAGESMSSREVSTIRYFLGSSYGKMGDLAGAKRNLQIAVQVDPSNRDAQAMLAQIP